MTQPTVSATTSTMSTTPNVIGQRSERREDMPERLMFGVQN